MLKIKNMVLIEIKLCYILENDFGNNNRASRCPHLFQRQLLIGLSQVLVHGVDDMLVSLGHRSHFLAPLLQGRNLSAVG